ncbi:pullulanase-type alpha-1,6-glucosidase [Microbulbifer bruguierae]|uniref:Pullulanase-type alpha-1,6-glucosidase n=1 Tax=Microbulbifer bruguierae TaxID=3029061 RepID=A0ABY8NEZ2_9GAMM|nr:pullulanase-type alpha-1,6-glucosidase [Microbulbifer bruguierae]WGL17491.1 pullulanase-type alpha-1,6-glucosidase [Microbulbifer bruguierae]
MQVFFRARGRVHAASLLATAIAVSVHGTALASTNSELSMVNIPGSLQTAIGCEGDWQPECAVSQLTYDEQDDIWQGSFPLPAGNYEYKVAINGSWDENYGGGADPGGPNIGLSLAATGPIKFIYDHETKWIADNVRHTVVTAAGDFQSELGCPGDWQPDCLRSWLQDVDGDGIYTFITSEIPAGDYQMKAALHEGWDESYGSDGSNIAFTVEAGKEVYFAFDSATKTVVVSTDGIPKGDLSTDKAHWVDAQTIVWPLNLPEGGSARLVVSDSATLELGPDGVSGDSEIALQLNPQGMSTAAQARFPHLAGHTVFTLPATADIAALVRGQLALAIYDAEGNIVDASGVQTAGVLDAVFAYDGTLGASVSENAIDFALWAPTAKSVTVHLYDSSDQYESSAQVEMTSENGVWSASTSIEWNRKFYLYEVEVYSYASRRIETNWVSDPYSLSLSANSHKSQIVDLNDADLKPEGWDATTKPALHATEDISLYELHVRDFSVRDDLVSEAARGTFAAFTEDGRGMLHLAELAGAGLTHVHLLPAFDFATVNEDRTAHLTTPDLSVYAADSTEQQAAVNAIRDGDGFNWGYDPLHFTVPEGSYATDPDGVQRIVEFRQMVQSLNDIGLRVVMDVVYNHTSSFGQHDRSILDKIVPGYYHRRNNEGFVEMSSCCANTASEHTMMEKLMRDSIKTWATAYKVDGFRFDLMGHHSRENILSVAADMHALTIEDEGVDGSAIYLYGEGWNFGEVADDARFTQARQANMAGTGVGTFNDRLRDSVRGGNPFGGYEEQGFGTGLYSDSNGKFGGSDERATLLTLADKVRISLTGNLASYTLTDSSGASLTGAELIYNGQPTGYTADPQESINYVAAHDNETLFDGIQIKANSITSLADRVRLQNFSNSLVMLAQGVPFIHAGQEFLRSKSMDRDSYNSGDWFNALDFSLATDNWAAGLPVADKNEDKWALMAPLLANPEIAPQQSDREFALAVFKEWLQIRASSGLFRLPTAEAVTSVLSFANTGPDQIPGLIAMHLKDPAGDFDGETSQIVALFNGGSETVEFTLESAAALPFTLHPIQQQSVDEALAAAGVDAGVFTVPARTTAVFVLARADDSSIVVDAPEEEETPQENNGRRRGGSMGFALLALFALALMRRRLR